MNPATGGRFPGDVSDAAESFLRNYRNGNRADALAVLESLTPSEAALLAIEICDRLSPREKQSVGNLLRG